jgi:hypothetical protein
LQSRPLSVVHLWLETSTFSVVLVSFSSVMIFLVVSSVVVVLQGQVVLQRLLKMLSMAQEALWVLALSVLGLRVLPLVLVPIQYPSPHRHHPAHSCPSRSSHNEPNHTTSLHDLLLRSWHLCSHVGSAHICHDIHLTSVAN